MGCFRSLNYPIRIFDVLNFLLKFLKSFMVHIRFCLFIWARSRGTNMRLLMALRRMNLHRDWNMIWKWLLYLSFSHRSSLFSNIVSRNLNASMIILISSRIEFWCLPILSLLSFFWNVSHFPRSWLRFALCIFYEEYWRRICNVKFQISGCFVCALSWNSNFVSYGLLFWNVSIFKKLSLSLLLAWCLRIK